MEQIQNQETNTIVIDDGSKEYDIKNHYGENLAVFRFRPADTNIISRYEEVQQYFANFTIDEKETVTECEQRVIEKMDYLMGADTGSTFFSILGPFSPMANGKLFVEVCMDTLRDVINKGLTEEIILEGAGQAFEGGWNKVKLYFMLGLPTETEEDMKAIAHLAEKVARRYYEIPKEQRNGKCQITASSSFFIPKPFTPFQWAQMFPSEEYIRRATIVKHEFLQQLNKKSLKYNWHEADVTVLEGVFARGDRKVGKVIEEAYRLGCLYDSWSESFDNEKWMQAFANTGVDIEFYTMRKRSMDELFPWDFIDIGVTKNFLKKEWERAMNAQVTPNCRMQCSGCGAAKFGGGVCFEGKN